MSLMCHPQHVANMSRNQHVQQLVHAPWESFSQRQGRSRCSPLCCPRPEPAEQQSWLHHITYFNICGSHRPSEEITQRTDKRRPFHRKSESSQSIEEEIYICSSRLGLNWALVSLGVLSAGQISLHHNDCRLHRNLPGAQASLGTIENTFQGRYHFMTMSQPTAQMWPCFPITDSIAWEGSDANTQLPCLILQGLMWEILVKVRSLKRWEIDGEELR